MIKLLVRIPRWLTVVAAIAAAVALAAVSYLPASNHGLRATALVAVVVLTGLAIGLPQLTQWQAEQNAAEAARLHLTFDFEPSVIPAFSDPNGVIDAWLTNEEWNCLAPLRAAAASLPARRRRHGFDAGNLDADPADAAPAGDATEARTLMERKLAGESLTAHQEVLLTGASALMSAAATRAILSSAAGLTDFMTDPDTRTPDEYRQEVDAYANTCRNLLPGLLRSEYVAAGLGRLRITIVNDSDRTVENVQVEIYLPGEVEAVDEDRLRAPVGLPSQPWWFGKRRPKAIFDQPPSYPMAFAVPTQFGGTPTPHPGIDNSASARVKFPSVTLRARERLALHDLHKVHLIVREAPGHIIRGTLQATATNAEGRIVSEIAVEVATTPLPVRDLLAARMKLSD